MPSSPCNRCEQQCGQSCITSSCRSQCTNQCSSVCPTVRLIDSLFELAIDFSSPFLLRLPHHHAVPVSNNAPRNASHQRASNSACPLVHSLARATVRYYNYFYHRFFKTVTFENLLFADQCISACPNSCSSSTPSLTSVCNQACPVSSPN